MNIRRLTQLVGIIHVAEVVLIVVELKSATADVRLKRVVSVGQILQSDGHFLRW